MKRSPKPTPTPTPLKYRFREALLTIKEARNADPQKIGEALAAISAAHDGHMAPKHVVQTARDESHCLHRHFEWKDAVAAEAYRLDQARALIRCIDIVQPAEKPPQPAFFSIAEDGGGGTSYRTLDDVMKSADLQVAVLTQAQRDVDALVKRLRGFEDLCAGARDLRDRIENRKRSFAPAEASQIAQ